MTTLNSSKKATVQKVLHRTACFLGGGLVVAYFLLHIALTVSISFDELEKFSALGSSQPLGYYLKKNCLAEHLFIFLGILAEFLLYRLLYRRANEDQPLPWGIRYVRIMLAFHAALLLLGVVLYMCCPYPFKSFERTNERIARHCLWIGSVTILPSALYCAAYLTCVKKHTSKLKQDTVASSKEK